MIFVFCQVEVSATRRSLVRKVPNERDVFESAGEAATVRRPRPTGDCLVMTGNVDMIQ